jgi:hypothetical protein
MNRADRSAYEQPSFPAEPMDTPRRKEILLTDPEQTDPQDEAAVSEGWPLSRLCHRL